MCEVPVGRPIPADSDGRGPAEDESAAVEDGDRTEQALVRALAELDDLNRRVMEHHRRAGQRPSRPRSV